MHSSNQYLKRKGTNTTELLTDTTAFAFQKTPFYQSQIIDCIFYAPFSSPSFFSLGIIQLVLYLLTLGEFMTIDHSIFQ